MEFEEGSLRVRPLRGGDALILCRWLNDPRVLTFYEGRDKPHNIHMVRRRFLSKTDPNQVLGHLVLWNGSPLGYIQTYFLKEETITGFRYSGRNRVYGMDLFLGEPKRWNQESELF